MGSPWIPIKTATVVPPPRRASVGSWDWHPPAHPAAALDRSSQRQKKALPPDAARHRDPRADPRHGQDLMAKQHLELSTVLT